MSTFRSGVPSNNCSSSDASPGTRNSGEENERDGNACKASWTMTSQVSRNSVGRVAAEKYKRNRLSMIKFSKYNELVA